MCLLFYPTQMIATVVVLYILKLAGCIKFPDYSLSAFHKVSWLKKKQCKSFEQWETELWEDAACNVSNWQNDLYMTADNIWSILHIPGINRFLNDTVINNNTILWISDFLGVHVTVTQTSCLNACESIWIYHDEFSTWSLNNKWNKIINVNNNSKDFPISVYMFM